MNDIPPNINNLKNKKMNNLIKMTKYLKTTSPKDTEGKQPYKRNKTSYFVKKLQIKTPMMYQYMYIKKLKSETIQNTKEDIYPQKFTNSDNEK